MPIPEGFPERHIGLSEESCAEMLGELGCDSLDSLVDEAVPASIRLGKALVLPEPLSESGALAELREIMGRNVVRKSFIGQGYHGTITPAVIQRNILENPGWYTAYTPYQAEISQGRLEALLNYQTMVLDLTGMELANSSLLDEGTAAAEAMILAFNSRSRAAKKAGANQFFVSEKCLPQTIDILKTRSNPLGIELIIGDYNSFEFNEIVFGAIVQYPDVTGQINNYKEFAAKAHANESLVIAAADILSLTDMSQ